MDCFRWIASTTGVRWRKHSGAVPSTISATEVWSSTSSYSSTGASYPRQSHSFPFHLFDGFPVNLISHHGYCSIFKYPTASVIAWFHWQLWQSPLICHSVWSKRFFEGCSKGTGKDLAVIECHNLMSAERVGIKVYVWIYLIFDIWRLYSDWPEERRRRCAMCSSKRSCPSNRSPSKMSS